MSGRFDFQYTGQAWMPELGMYYYKARMYSPLLGRFMQRDPIGYGDGMNMYAYVGNDPVNAIDPGGRCGFQWSVAQQSTDDTGLTVVSALRGFERWICPRGGEPGDRRGNGGGGGAGDSGDGQSPLNEILEEIEVAARRIRQNICRYGNGAQATAQVLGEAGTAVELAGLPLALFPPTTEFGVPMVTAGGTLNMTGAAVQMNGGMAQMYSGHFRTGFSNWWHGGVNLGASAVGMQFFNFFRSAGRNAAQRAYNRLVDGGAAAGGISIDVVAWASPDFVPVETNCGD